MFVDCSEINIRAIVKHVNVYVQYLHVYIRQLFKEFVDTIH